jgi:hypothetical protein
MFAEMVKSNAGIWLAIICNPCFKAGSPKVVKGIFLPEKISSDYPLVLEFLSFPVNISFIESCFDEEFFGRLSVKSLYRLFIKYSNSIKL